MSTQSFCLDIGAADEIGWRACGFFATDGTAWFALWYNDGFGFNLLNAEGIVDATGAVTLAQDGGKDLSPAQLTPPMPLEFLRQLGTRICALRPAVTVEATDG